MLLDTCVVSELIRPAPDPRVVAWLEAADDERLRLSALTLGDVRKGIARLASGSKRQRLEAWAERLRSEFQSRILPIDDAIALRWGDITAAALTAGHPVAAIDGLLAATAMHHEIPLITRNASDYRGVAVTIIDPWA